MSRQEKETIKMLAEKHDMKYWIGEMKKATQIINMFSFFSEKSDGPEEYLALCMALTAAVHLRAMADIVAYQVGLEEKVQEWEEKVVKTMLENN